MYHFDSINTPDDEVERGSRRKECKKPSQFSIRRSFLITLVCIALGFIMILPVILHWPVGKRFDQRTFENHQFTLRITAFHERGTFMGMGAPGGFYLYEVKTRSDWRWRTITMFQLGVPEPIPDDHLQRVSDSNAYFFHGCVFGVTKDGGKSWSIKGGFDNPPIFSGQPDVNAYIEMVSIGQDGVGMMQLFNYDSLRWKPLPSLKLVTSDFGQTWSKPRVDFNKD